MNPEYEAHNFNENSIPRHYEAIFVQDDLLLKVVVEQRNRQSVRGQKPMYRWQAGAWAWTPGQGDEDDYTHLCHLMPSEMVVREVRADGNADPEDFLEAVRLDAEKVFERAGVFIRVLASARQGQSSRKKVRA